MKTRLTKAWRAWPIGHVFTAMPGNLARELIKRGIAVEVAEDPPAKESRFAKALSAPVNRMMTAPASKRR